MNRIKTCREALGYSQKYVAISVGVSAPTVSMWESGAKDPTRDNLVKLADLFGVTTDYLLEREAAGENMAVSPDEREVLLAYRQAAPMLRAAVQAVLGMNLQEKSAQDVG